MEEKIDETNEILKNYPDLKNQYLFNKCFVVSSKELNDNYKETLEKYENNIKDIEIYYSPDYLYKQFPKSSLFDIINNQTNKDFYFLKEHIFYYRYLLECIKAKEKSYSINTKGINEIFYRALLNRLYLLHDDPNANDNYGKNQIFGIPCIYSILEPDIINQIMNMKKFSFEILKMDKNKVNQLFGINKDIENQSFIFNQILISITMNNSRITSNSQSEEDIEDFHINKENREIIEKEKYLINLSNELFVFNYITNQLDKDKFIQLPRLIFFSNLYNEELQDVYEILNNKKKEREKEESENKEKEKNSKNDVSKGIDNDNKNINNQSKDKIKIDKNLLNCKLLDFYGFLELDGAFKYVGEKKELISESIVIVLSECLNRDNNIQEYIKKSNAEILLKLIKNNQSNLETIKKNLIKYKIIQNSDTLTKENMEKLEKKLKDEAKEIKYNKKIIISINDIVLIETKRGHPHHLINELENFIDHSFYFIHLYKNIEKLEKESTIHLIFIYNHVRNYEDENLSYKILNDIIENNKQKLGTIDNEIKFYLIHSLPNLNLTIIDRVENDISDMKKEIKSLKENNAVINELYKEIQNLKKEIKQMKSEKK